MSERDPNRKTKASKSAKRKVLQMANNLEARLPFEVVEDDEIDLTYKTYTNGIFDLSYLIEKGEKTISLFEKFPINIKSGLDPNDREPVEFENDYHTWDCDNDFPSTFVRRRELIIESVDKHPFTYFETIEHYNSRNLPVKSALDTDERNIRQYLDPNLRGFTNGLIQRLREEYFDNKFAIHMPVSSEQLSKFRDSLDTFNFAA